ncbi:actin depolymerizing protein [Venturia nashicola]|uniref:Twinfilin n=1 Tax=Venturia nashicola TaxID=86259 RepID=A0A4Z1NP42_9PEZI|nr:actin depolymerizing protein [Venturia nashicola]TLD20807.1 actin depolymerizing protein [Venturia nashicola]
MQSGISASQELHDAFSALKSDTSKRGLIATINKEVLVPGTTIPSTSQSFAADLSNLQPHLKPNEALYILLRLDASSPTGPAFTAITYVPDAAPVRQKMLFASTRLTLTRELGGENFTDTLFCTLAEELSAEGWKKHEAHEKLENPLTEEERNLVGIKEAELTEVGGTGRRGAGYGGSSGLKMTGGDGVVEALSSLGERGLVMLKIDASETIVLAEAPVEGVKTSELASHIAAGEPRYSFYKHSYNGVDGPATATVFIYTCPTASKVKDRMLYASSRRSAESLAEKEAGLKLAKKLEATDPSEITAQTIDDEFETKQETKSGFSKPKRPGRR